MKTKNTNPKPRPERPLRVYKMGQFIWVVRCRRCWFIEGHDSHLLAMKVAQWHHSKCRYKATEQTCS